MKTTGPSALTSAGTIMLGMWMRRRREFAALFGLAFVAGLILRWLPGENGVAVAASNAGLGLSLAATFILCGFTETHAKTGVSGFPTRLFTLPASSIILVAAPIAFAVLFIMSVYLVWAGFTVSARNLPLTWPLLYLAAGMISYQAIVWSLAQHRVFRIIVLGYIGAVFAMGWLFFRADADGPLAADLSDATRQRLIYGLAAIAVVAQATAWMAVDAQRRGGIGGSARATRHALMSAFLRRRALNAARSAAIARPRFSSGFDAQFWLEWRRHGKLLPSATAAVLFIIMVPGFFVRPVSPAMTALALAWITATPLLIAFVLGKGLGKPDLWSGDTRAALFGATRPLSSAALIRAKVKMAAVAALATWMLIIVSTAAWLSSCCELQELSRGWTMLEQRYSRASVVAGSCALLLMLALLTFRFLAGSLYVGLSGRRWLMNLSACGVFACLFGGMFGALAIADTTLNLRLIVDWIPAVTAGIWVLFGIRLALTIGIATHCLREHWLDAAVACRYAVFWVIATTAVAVIIWHVPGASERWKMLLLALSLFVVPMLRLSLAPMALAQRFHV